MHVVFTVFVGVGGVCPPPARKGNVGQGKGEGGGVRRVVYPNTDC